MQNRHQTPNALRLQKIMEILLAMLCKTWPMVIILVFCKTNAEIMQDFVVDCPMVSANGKFELFKLDQNSGLK